jgi:hypothetical protein
MINFAFPLGSPNFVTIHNSSVWAAIREPLSRNGLATVRNQTTGPGEEVFVEVVTALVHSSGEWVSGTLRLPVARAVGNGGPRAFGSALAYARRYGLQAMVGVAPLGEASPDSPLDGGRKESYGEGGLTGASESTAW